MGDHRPLTEGVKAQQIRSFRLAVIQPALDFAKGSRARGRAITEIAARLHVHPSGMEKRVPRRTVARWIEDYEREGMAGLTRKKPKHVGQRITILFRAWDRAVLLDDADKAGIAHALLKYIRGLVKAGQPQQVIRILASHKLAKLTARAGYDPGFDTLEKICLVPLHLIARERQLRKVHRFNSDRKAYEDARPRIKRSRDGLLPGDVIVGDVHPIDILVRRPDGSIATPRAIAWLDLATNRIWVDVVLLEKGRGIRNAHVIESFIRMVRAWGVPTVLYLDNGTEYNWAEFIDLALKLIDREGRRLIDRLVPWHERASNIVRARPYNAAAKAIEGIFAVLEASHFAAIPGWIGGDRMEKKSANVGREPDPFPGTFEQLRSLIAAAIEFYHRTPQRGSLSNQTPLATYEKFIAQGWGKVDVEPDALAIAFSTEEARQVRQGRVQCLGREWTCTELQAYQGDRVSVLIPKYETWSRLPVRDDAGRLLGFAVPDDAYGILDPAGAVEGQARALVHRRAVRALDRSAPDIDPLAERIAYLEGQAEPQQAPVVAKITPSDEAAAIIKGLRETPSERFEREADERSRLLAERLALADGRRKRAANDA